MSNDSLLEYLETQKIVIFKISKAIPGLRALLPVCNGFLRFTLSATPTNLLIVSMAVGSLFWTNRLAHVETNIGKTDSNPGMSVRHSVGLILCTGDAERTILNGFNNGGLWENSKHK